jgi:hypothetical protein
MTRKANKIGGLVLNLSAYIRVQLLSNRAEEKSSGKEKPV